MAIVSLLVSLGSANIIELYKNFEDIFDTFDLSSLSKAPAKLNISSLKALSQKAVQELSINEVEDYIFSIGVPKDLSRNFWDMAKENISRKNDMEELCKSSDESTSQNCNSCCVRFQVCSDGFVSAVTASGTKSAPPPICMSARHSNAPWSIA